MVSIKEVAAEAKVSVATVSRVLNSKRPLDDVYADRVRAAIAKLEYRVDPAGRALRTLRSGMWSFIASDIENPFFAAVLRGLEDVALDNDRLVTLSNTREQPDREARMIESAIAHRVAGLVVATASTDTVNLTRALETEIPVVLVDRAPMAGDGIDSVSVDNRNGAYAAVSHLLERGYERIACVTGPPEAITSSQRLDGYRAALIERGIEVDHSLVRIANFRREGGAAAAIELLDLPVPPDAIFSCNGRMAAGIVSVAHAHGVRIGEGLGLASFDDETWMELVTPAVTAVRQPTYELGRIAGELLVQREQEPGRSDRSHRVLDAALVVRDSSAGRDAGGR